MHQAALLWNHFVGRRFALLALILAFTLFGCIASLQSGLTVDDATEQFTFRTITGAAKSLLLHRLDEYNRLQSLSDRYYGIGFDMFAYPFQILLQPYVAGRLRVDNETALLLARRPAVFLLFVISVVVFYRCARFFIQERSIAMAASAAYAACPYLFGHAMINLRDSPFMSVYLICTYLSLKLVRRRLLANTDSHRADVVGLAFATAALASIRLPGLMILVQYAFTFVLADYCKRDAREARLLRWQNIAWFCSVLVALVVLVFPAVWLNPLREIVAGMNYVGWYYQPGCTLTWGQCMKPYASLAYVLDWLVVKVPLVVLAGIAFVPFVLKKIWRDPLRRIAYLTLLFGSVYVLIVIIPLRARLYDETRQLLFIYPLLFLLAFIAIYLVSRRLMLVATVLAIGIFFWDHVRLYPYQYVYFNEFGRFLDIDSLFETDYWGISAREHARVLQIDSRFMTGLNCLYADPIGLYRPFIDPNTCVEPVDALTEYPSRKGVVVAITCSPNRSKAPATCWQIASITRKLPLSNRVVTMSTAYYCSPLQ